MEALARELWTVEGRSSPRMTPSSIMDHGHPGECKALPWPQPAVLTGCSVAGTDIAPSPSRLQWSLEGVGKTEGSAGHDFWENKGCSA